MRIRYLSLTNFRNYTRLELTLPQRPLLIYGANAQGKTTLLESIYLLATGSSPLTSSDRELIRWQAEDEGLPYARVWGEIDRQHQTEELEVVLEKNTLSNGSTRLQKTIRIDRHRKRRADLAGRLNVVVFMPQDVEIIAGSPSRRRRYMDDTLCQVDGAYCDALDRYTDAVRQRNAALRHIRDEGGDPSQLAPFERTLTREGIALIKTRRQLLDNLSQRAKRIHEHLTGGNEWLRLDYRPSFEPDPEATAEDMIEAFRRALRQRQREEIARGVTVIGPHRDDVDFVAGRPTQGTHEVDLRTYGSRGQQRTAVLALKLAELEWMKAQTREAPVLLLDEVLAELDATRRGYLLAQMEEVEQALLTATDLEMFSERFRKRAALWKVEGGIVQPLDRATDA